MAKLKFKNPQAGMSSGTPARVESLRPSSSSTSRRGGFDAAGGGQEGVQVKSSESEMIKEVLPVVEAGGGGGYYHQEEPDAQDEEEADVSRPLPTPEMPTRSEFEDHCVTHVFRIGRGAITVTRAVAARPDTADRTMRVEECRLYPWTTRLSGIGERSRAKSRLTPRRVP